MRDEDGYFGEAIAATYDDADDPMFTPDAVEPTVDFLGALAGDGRALELGVGTGRIALPLAARGGSRAWRRSLDGDGRPTARQAGRRQYRDHDW